MYYTYNIIGHINPVRLQLRESLSTLNFLSFTRTITTRPQVNAWDARPHGKRGAFGKTETGNSVLFTNSIGKCMGYKQCAHLLRSAGFGHKELLLMAAELSGRNIGTHIGTHTGTHESFC